MNPEQRLALIKRNTSEIVTEAELLKLIQLKKHPVVYLGTAITGRPHIGYFVWVIKLADFLKAGFTVKLLLADLHGALDNTPWPVLEKRYHYYSAILPLMFTAVGANAKQIKIVKGSAHQLQSHYILDMLKMSTFTSVHDATKAASEVVKFGDNPKLSGIIYPLMQALDEQYLGVDIQFGGADQRKILMFAREHLLKLGYSPRVEIMTPLIPGLIGKKMSASDPKSKIDLLDDEETVNSKIKDAYCPEGAIEDNGVLAFLRHVVMVLEEDSGKPLLIERPAKYGGNITFKTYPEIEESYLKKQLHPQDLKTAVAREINDLLKIFRKNKDKLNTLSREGYA